MALSRRLASMPLIYIYDHCGHEVPKECGTADSTVSAWLDLISAVCWSRDSHVTIK